MSKLEKRVLDWVQQHLFVIFCIAVTLCSMMIRFYFRKFESGDYSECLLPWWKEIREAGGIFALKEQVGNYNMLYQLLIALMTYLPIKPLYEYKILSIIFDYLLAAVVGYLIYDMLGKDKYKGVLAYAAVIMSPIVFLNSSAWSQCDAIYVFFIILSLLFIFNEHYTLSFIMVGIAFSFKLQTIFVIPFFVFLYVYKKRFSILNFLIIPLTMCITAIPCLVTGRNVREVFSNYLLQVDTYSSMSLNYPSIWIIFSRGGGFETLKNPAIIVTVTILGIFMYMWLINEHAFGKKELLKGAFLIVYTCVLFLPDMHERYGYLYEILAIMIAFIDQRTSLLCIILNMLSVVTYGAYLYHTSYNDIVLAVINVLTYIFYLYLLLPDLTGKEKADNK